jgi:hypothetical protein
LGGGKVERERERERERKREREEREREQAKRRRRRSWVVPGAELVLIVIIIAHVCGALTVKPLFACIRQHMSAYVCELKASYTSSLRPHTLVA